MSYPVENNEPYNPIDSSYFKSLPSFVQETIMQSSGLIKNEEELRTAAEKMMNEN